MKSFTIALLLALGGCPKSNAPAPLAYDSPEMLLIRAATVCLNHGSDFVRVPLEGERIVVCLKRKGRREDGLDTYVKGVWDLPP